MSNQEDCIVIGGGPAGLVAATYLARFRLSALVLSAGPSRAAYIPRTRNVPAYPHGLKGSELLLRLRRQARNHGAALVPARAVRIAGRLGDFEVETPVMRLRARTLLLATGAHDILPAALQRPDSAVRSGRVRLCPICDALEVTGAPLLVLGHHEKAGREALFLRDYSASVTLLTDGHSTTKWSAELRRLLSLAAIRIEERPVASIVAGTRSLSVTLKDGTRMAARALYAALGVHVHSELAAALGARCDEEGFLYVNRHQQTSVSGLYAAGDVVQALSQISVAFGQAAIAATAIRNALREEAQRKTCTGWRADGGGVDSRASHKPSPNP